MTLAPYRRKRDFTRTGEPAPQVAREGAGALQFVVHKHAARQLHYDFRLELDGVLKSWSVPKGVSTDPSEKRLAVLVEDHPFDYRTFEGVIPAGQYGGGQVIIWDRGTYSPDEGGRLSFDDRAEAQVRMRRGLADRKLSFTLRGEKLKGSFTLVKMRQGESNWLLIKHRDEHAGTGDILADGRSVVSGLTVEGLKASGGSTRREDSADDTVEIPLNLPLRKGEEERGAPLHRAASDLPGARKAAFPRRLSPMLATLGGEAFDGPDWLFEPKLDGYRILAFISGGKARLLTRNGTDVTDRYAALVPDLERQPVKQAVLDGEVIALDGKGRSCFQCLQGYLESLRGAKRGATGVPIIYYVFDMLYLDGYDLCGVPLLERKRVLAGAFRPTASVRLVDYFAREGKTVYRAAIQNGLEGMIAKRADSIYEPGKRTPGWVKVKATRTDEFVIGGYTQGEGARDATFRSLLLGYYDEADRLVFAGHVGTGFDAARLAAMRRQLDKLRTRKSPFRQLVQTNTPAVWVHPRLVAEVKYKEVTQGGLLRTPVFLRLRDDKPAVDVRRPAPPQPAVAAVTPGDDVDALVERISKAGDSLSLEVGGEKVGLTHLDKELWPSGKKLKAVTKRDLLTYLAAISPWLLPHLKDRPLTLTRYPDGIGGEHFYQKHWAGQRPQYVQTVTAPTGSKEERGEYVVCNNLPTLLWLGQIADIELHTWYSRSAAGPDLGPGVTAREGLRYPDFMVFDIDPYIYSGDEPKGAEPELNRRAFKKGCEAAAWLHEVLDGLGLLSFLKTSGRTGLHVYVPLRRQLDHRAVRAGARTICEFVLHKHPKEITTDWAVEKRRGKIFLDYGQNTLGKTLASVYSPRPTPQATVSMPLAWNELGKHYPTEFTVFNAAEHVRKAGDLWAGILDTKADLAAVLKLK